MKNVIKSTTRSFSGALSSYVLFTKSEVSPNISIQELILSYRLMITKDENLMIDEPIAAIDLTYDEIVDLRDALTEFIDQAFRMEGRGDS